MEQRRLEFADYADVLAEVDRLHRGGYEKAGQWDLAQTCDHLRFFVEGSLDGPNYRVPWIFKMLLGKLVLKQILSKRWMKAGITTPQKPLPDPGGDEAAAVARYQQIVQRLQAH